MSAGYYGSPLSPDSSEAPRSGDFDDYYHSRNQQQRGSKVPMRRTRPLSSSVVAAKTRLCQRFVRGNCTSQNCTFAHGDSELRKKPDLRKTKLCDAFSSNRSCPKGADCTYAHGHHELQSTSEYFKTSICPNWKQGHCQSGDYCRHAHGTQELRSRVTPSGSGVLAPTVSQDNNTTTNSNTPSTASSFYDPRGMTMELVREDRQYRSSRVPPPPSGYDTRPHHTYSPSSDGRQMYSKQTSATYEDTLSGSSDQYHQQRNDMYSRPRTYRQQYLDGVPPRPLYSSSPAASPPGRFTDRRKVWPGRQSPTWRPSSRSWETGPNEYQRQKQQVSPAQYSAGRGVMGGRKRPPFHAGHDGYGDRPPPPQSADDYSPQQEAKVAPVVYGNTPMHAHGVLALTPVRELKSTEEMHTGTVPSPRQSDDHGLLTDEDHISSSDDEAKKRTDQPPPSESPVAVRHGGGRSSSVHVCAGAYMDGAARRGSEGPFWNRWNARAASAFYSSTPGSRRQSKQSILCIDLSDTKPAAADAYPLAALVGRHMDGSPNRRRNTQTEIPQSPSAARKKGQRVSIDFGQRKSSEQLPPPPPPPAVAVPPPPPAETVPPPSHWPTDGGLLPGLAQGVPVVPTANATPGLTVPGLPVSTEATDAGTDAAAYGMPFLAATVHPLGARPDLMAAAASFTTAEPSELDESGQMWQRAGYHHPYDPSDYPGHRRAAAAGPFIALSPNGPVVIDPMTFRALVQGGQAAAFSSPEQLGYYAAVAPMTNKVAAEPHPSSASKVEEAAYT